LKKRRLQQNTVGLITAADVRKASVTNSVEIGLPFSIVVTAGVSNATAAGDDPRRFQEKTGTINMIILLDFNPTDACLIEIVKTVTEAKTVVLRELDILSRASNRVATGTSTDTVTVASTCRGKIVNYAGTATALGRALSRRVIEAVKEAIRKQDGIRQDRPLRQRLEERGITSNMLIKAVRERLPGKASSKTRRHLLHQARVSVQKALHSVDTASTILASLKICEDAATSQAFLRVARGLGASVAYLIGGKAGGSQFQKICSNWKQSSYNLVVEGIVSGVIGAALEGAQPSI